MFVGSWRAWLEGWFRGARRRSPLRNMILRHSEQLEGRFFLGQLSLPAVDVDDQQPQEEIQVDSSEVAVPNAHEELAQALESVFREISVGSFLNIDGSPQVLNEEGVTFTASIPAQPAPNQNADEESEFDFSSISDVAHADLLLDSLRTGEPLALTKAAREERKAERKLARSGNGTDSETAESSPGLMVHDGGSASGSPSSSSNTGTSDATPINSTSNSSGIGTGSLNLPNTSGVLSNNGAASNSSLDQVMATLGATSSSSSNSTGTASSGQTYLASSGTVSRPEVLASFTGNPQLSTGDVQTLLQRASEATPSNDAIIAVVDRQGNILGVRTESGVPITDTNTLVFAIDGAVAEARTAAFFSSDQGPLTSRTVQFISQSTITQREVESNPSITDMTSTVAGPGFVAPIGLGG
ncbi:MAG: uncharacterized protein JWM11_6336, partial [Planctomycetaceae bacterium]|nr:uncharacterized protein [Planctomycetaceae bacterium]